ncbi:hypothetical protein Q8G38_00400 [Halomonas venusta]|uniref:hypothetical protein n=1 Tax=Vreelandella venusta TaxID=44935 RepID=UPI00295EAF5E|nr:hypothetical protein [Halomonas venusta]MDW0357769.1 hypothetical protein [Halomonas venusta]
MTDAELQRLVSLPKKITNPRARTTTQRKSIQRTYYLETPDGEPSMELKLRQNTLDEDHFSCVLLCHLPNGDKLILRRYNGSNHIHGNKLDPDMGEIVFTCHIHMAKQRYIEKGLRSDDYAEQTEAYRTFEGAISCIIKDCNITGHEPRGSERNLDFDF